MNTIQGANIFAFCCPVPSDTIPPDTTITSGPAGTITYNTVTFQWTGSDNVTPPSNLVYSYYLVGYDTNWSPYTPDTSKTYQNLSNKYYVFYVKAKDQAGNIDLSPAFRTFFVRKSHAVNYTSLGSALFNIMTGGYSLHDYSHKNGGNLASQEKLIGLKIPLGNSRTESLVTQVLQYGRIYLFITYEKDIKRTS